MQIHKFSAPDRRGVWGDPVEAMEPQSSVVGDKTYTRDKEIRLGINFKWDAFPCLLATTGRLLWMPRNLIWWHSSMSFTSSSRLQSNLWLNYQAIFNVSNKLVYKIIPTRRCLGFAAICGALRTLIGWDYLIISKNT